VSESGRGNRPGHHGPSQGGPEIEDPELEPRSGGLFGPARMDGVKAERAEVADSLRRRLAVMRKASGAPSPQAYIPQGAGAPLSSDVRAKMEPRLGADLSGARIHTSGESAQASQQLGARAFTVGEDVHFNAGEYAPGTKEGDRLLAHELTHVVQGQRTGIQRKAEHDDAKGGGAEVSQPGEPAEKEADKVGDKVADDLHGGGGKKDAKAGGKGGDKDKGGKDAKGKGGEQAKIEHADEKEEHEGEGDEHEAKGGHAAGGAAGAAAHGKGEKKGKGKGKDKDKDKDAHGDEHAHEGHEGKEGHGDKDGKDAKGEHDGAARHGGGAGHGKDEKGAHGGGKGDAGEAKAGEKPAAPISAKLIGVGRKIFRATGGNAPAPAAGGNANANANAAPQTPEQTLTSPQCAQFKQRYSALCTSLQMPADDAAAEKIWLDVVKVLQATDAAYKAAPAAAPNSPRKDLTSDAFQKIMKQFDPIIGALSPMMEKFAKGKKVWAFWSGKAACEIAKANSEVCLEKSALGGLFDGININGSWDTQMWASLSKAYATHAAKDAETKTYKGFVGKGSSAEQSIFNKIEQPQFVSMLDQKAAASLKITWYACATDPKAPDKADPTVNVGGMPGVMGSGDRGSMVAMAESVNDKRAKLYSMTQKVVAPDQVDKALEDAEKQAAAGGAPGANAGAPNAPNAPNAPPNANPNANANNAAGGKQAGAQPQAGAQAQAGGSSAAPAAGGAAHAPAPAGQPKKS
jgi:hypothetical protein